MVMGNRLRVKRQKTSISVHKKVRQFGITLQAIRNYPSGHVQNTGNSYFQILDNRHHNHYDPGEMEVMQEQGELVEPYHHSVIQGRTQREPSTVIVLSRHRLDFREARNARICKAPYLRVQNHIEKSSKNLCEALLSLCLNSNLPMYRVNSHEDRQETFPRKKQSQETER